MVGQVIRDYMEGGAKKLTVPGFGTFMRKDTGEVIFVDLLRRDDGALREMVEDYGRYSEVDAMALVDRFIFETKNSILRTGSSEIGGFGTMTLDGKGLYQFDYSPKAKPVQEENAVQERLFDNFEPELPEEPSPWKEGGLPESDEHPGPRSRPHSGSRPHRGSRSDVLVIVAVVVAAVALAAIIYGLVTGNVPPLNR